jgi:hypothetical protein
LQAVTSSYAAAAIAPKKKDQLVPEEVGAGFQTRPHNSRFYFAPFAIYAAILL